MAPATAQGLAIDGGPKTVTNKLKAWPQFDEHAIKAVEEVLRSGKVNYWTGRKGMEFEKRFAEWQGSKYAISVATGTAALHVALTALGIGPGDEVIVPSYTFIATSFSVVQAGAVPRFADVNIDDHCISVESAEKLVNQRTKAIIPVHLYGNVCDIDKIMDFARKHNLYVIEDNAEAFGGVYKGKKTGTIGHMAACSFCQNKTFTTGGEGGMVTTDDEELAWIARSFRDHGYGEGICGWPFEYEFLPSPTYDGHDYVLPAWGLFDLPIRFGIICGGQRHIHVTRPASCRGPLRCVVGGPTQAGGFDYRLDPAVPPGANQQAQIQAQATLDGTESRVITAVSFDASGNAVLISYGWTGDTTTVYEAQTTVVQASGVLATATNLAGEGYFIGAFGGNDTDGYVLVGMRVQGDILLRPIGQTVNSTAMPYYSPVLYLFDEGYDMAVYEQERRLL